MFGGGGIPQGNFPRGHAMEDKFHKRVQIQIALEEANQQFINRVRNEILNCGRIRGGPPNAYRDNACRAVASAFGEVCRWEQMHRQSLPRMGNGTEPCKRLRPFGPSFLAPI